MNVQCCAQLENSKEICKLTEIPSKRARNRLHHLVYFLFGSLERDIQELSHPAREEPTNHWGEILV